MLQQELVDILSDITKRHWSTHKKPLLLSSIPPLLVNQFQDYKIALSGRTLKRFVKETENLEDSQYKYIEHPSQKAKVGLTPKEINYLFPEPTNSNEINPTFLSDSEKSLINFLKALKNLSQEDQDKIHLPVSVIVNMIK